MMFEALKTQTQAVLVYSRDIAPKLSVTGGFIAVGEAVYCRRTRVYYLFPVLVLFVQRKCLVLLSE